MKYEFALSVGQLTFGTMMFSFWSFFISDFKGTSFTRENICALAEEVKRIGHCSWVSTFGIISNQFNVLTVAMVPKREISQFLLSKMWVVTETMKIGLTGEAQSSAETLLPQFYEIDSPIIKAISAWHFEDRVPRVY